MKRMKFPLTEFFAIRTIQEQEKGKLSLRLRGNKELITTVYHSSVLERFVSALHYITEMVLIAFIRWTD